MSPSVSICSMRKRYQACIRDASRSAIFLHLRDHSLATGDERAGDVGLRRDLHALDEPAALQVQTPLAHGQHDPTAVRALACARTRSARGVHRRGAVLHVRAVPPPAPVHESSLPLGPCPAPSSRAGRESRRGGGVNARRGRASTYCLRRRCPVVRNHERRSHGRLVDSFLFVGFTFGEEEGGEAGLELLPSMRSQWGRCALRRGTTVATANCCISPVDMRTPT